MRVVDFNVGHQKKEKNMGKVEASTTLHLVYGRKNVKKQNRPVGTGVLTIMAGYQYIVVVGVGELTIVLHVRVMSHE